VLGAIDHVALIVRDPARTAALFKELFQAQVLERRDAEGHDETFARLGRTWFVLVQGEPPGKITGDHIAFRVSAAELRSYAERLRQMGIEHQLARGDTALYFQDYDRHLFELDTADMESDLPERPEQARSTG
jgi:catechol 2,3-dioxygenase-like lactoylglutathione lyase family enzyme